MVYFTGTHCPTSHGVEKRLQTFLKSMKVASFGFVAINPNHSSGLRPDDFGHTRYDETFEDSKRYANDLGWEFPFLYDGDKQLAARAYGCLATPHVFIFDKRRKLRYQGRFDDSRLPDPESVKSPDAINLVKAVLAGEAVVLNGFSLSLSDFLSCRQLSDKEHMHARSCPNFFVRMKIASISASSCRCNQGAGWEDFAACAGIVVWLFEKLDAIQHSPATDLGSISPSSSGRSGRFDSR